MFIIDAPAAVGPETNPKENTVSGFLRQCLGVVSGVSIVTGMLAIGASCAIAQQPQHAMPPGLKISPEEFERRRGMGGYNPERMKNPNVSNTAPKMTITPPEDIPLNALQVPPGFQVELYAHGMPGARMMTRGDKGTIFIGTRIIGRVYALYERDGKRQSKIIADKMVQPNGVLFHNGSLYVAAINKVLRYDNIEANLDNIPTPVDLTEAFKLPPEVHHNWKFLAFGPDKKIYVPVGAPCNL